MPPAALTEPARDLRSMLSALWVFVMFNYLYADVIGLMDATLLTQYLRGQVDSLAITGELLFGAAVLMEIPIAMTLLTRVLPHRAPWRPNDGACPASDLAGADRPRSPRAAGTRSPSISGFF